MWKIALGAVMALPVTMGVAQAATVDVSISKTAFAPSSASLSTADTVKFTNNDTTAHQVAFKPATGVTCSPSPFVLQPAQSGTCTITAPGTFSYSDPTAPTLQGSFTVSEPAAPASLSLFAQPTGAVIYASKATLTGELSTRKAGESVIVRATPCGRSELTKAATMQTTSGGEYSIDLRPGRNTEYTVQSGTITSAPVTVKVRPRLRLGRIAAHRYSLRVFAAQKFAGRYASIQRYNAGNGRWIFVKRVRLHATSTHILPTVVSAVAFRSAITPGTRIRAYLPQLQAGACYQPGTSNSARA
jgi:plastocyanin